jgi:hypothetical protein
VQAQQCVQPTGPNRSMALPIPSPKAARPQAALQRSENRDQRTDPAWAGSALPSLSGAAFCDPCPTLHDSRGRRSEVRKGPDPGRHDARRISRLFSDLCSLSSELLPWPGGHSAGAPPDPIPNSAVKPRRAQGTAVLTVGERVVARPSQQFFPEIRGQRSETRWRRTKPEPLLLQPPSIGPPLPGPIAASASSPSHDSLPHDRVRPLSSDI